jgi:ABC-type cobalamin/Fe3+-siderophores transport system ATPase subunit
MKTEIQYYKDIFLKNKGKKELLENELKKSQDKKVLLDKRLKSIEKAQVLIQVTAKETQQNIEFHISDVVQLALDACFPGEYDFKVNFEIKRNRTEASLDFFKKGQKISKLTDDSGGGVVAIGCLALRMAAWSLGRTSPVLILDQPFVDVSVDLQPKAGEILRELSEKLGLQIIMITHNRESMTEIADKIFLVSRHLDEDGWKKSSVIEKMIKNP